ncbi:hypothetical protein JEY40_24675 [Bradyrhizobium japonicum]|uniref:hypothetical protein n=1 Tax=Bradyrhizobium japonicum TaxID=375 RepID=UPI002010A3E9|nr:hypothetical protein [Bradyrhizobium japonicum]UQD69214.1 hypothetical protein JEY40_24675 [Bradyrhizobium japonicum]WAX24476.1 hypothetical protein [Bradyrhizobium phage ppBjS10J-1]
MADNVAAVAVDDDFDVTADLTAAFDAAENDTPAPEPEPAGETAEQAAERVRDEKGRFAAKTEDPEPVAAKEPAKAAEPVKAEAVPAAAVDPLAPPAEPVKPPPGFSPTAKVVWDKETLSKEEWEAVKRDIAKRNDEVGKGLAELTEYKPIKQYIEMARQSGTTLDRALENYVGIENELRRDMVSGIGRICQNQGVHPIALANQILARFGAAPSEGQAGDQSQAHQQAPVDPNAIAKSVRDQIRAEQIQEEVNRSIKQFGSDPKNQFFENVRQDMTRLLQAGAAETLEDAYDKACWANTEIRNLLIKQQAPAASDPSAKVAAATQARAASKSITGSPVPGAGNKGPSISLEDEIRQLMDASV